jgi:acetaldehyde dehydrogenase (acetylating)
VGVIGAGQRITPLLSRMLEYEYVDVRMVVDPDPGAPGVLIAQSLGVTTTADPESLFKILDGIDFLFCVEDDADLRMRVISEFRRANNTRTVLLNELATRFITSLSKDSRHLVELLPPGAVHRYVPGFETD